MRLLICTQAVDAGDPALGFFVRWVAEFAKHCGTVLVICLRKGDYDLPQNVEVLSLGKEAGKGRVARVLRFLKLITSRRSDYDAVFVHMNPEYIVLAGPLWRLWGKRIAMWYTHKSVDLKLRIATAWTNIIFSASKESFRLATTKLRIMGHGIDTEFFAPDPAIPRGNAILSVGRLSPSKRHDLAIRAAVLAGRELRIAGDGPERAMLEKLAVSLNTRVTFLGGISQIQLRNEYRRAAVLVHTSETGSLDKVVLEALACDCPVITTSEGITDLPVEKVPATAQAIAKALEGAQRNYTGVSVVRKSHSLAFLIAHIVESYVA